VASTPAQERYGRRAPGPTPGGRRRLLIAGVVALVVVLAWISWVTLIRHPQLNWQDVGYDVRSDAQVVVTFDVTFTLRGGSRAGRPPSAICTVQAMNELHTEVGLKDVRVTAGPGGRVRAVVTLPTSERATTGLVKDCVLA
jgi:Domain of unknown function (DUF4307)